MIAYIVMILIVVSIFSFVIFNYFYTKKNYHYSYDGVSKIARSVYMKKDNDKVGLFTKSNLNVNENLRLEIEYFVGFVEIIISVKKDNEWTEKEIVNEDIWNKSNGLFKIKGPWKTEIQMFLKDEYTKLINT